MLIIFACLCTCALIAHMLINWAQNNPKFAEGPKFYDRDHSEY